MDIKVFETYEEAGEFLKKLQGDKDFLEIVERTKDKRFKEFIKLTFSKNIDKNSAINKISDVLKGQELISKNVGEIANVLNHTQILNSFNVFVSSANLVSTVVGFAIIYFDRAYFNKYKEWHLEHNDWLSNFDYLLSDAYKQKVQDYAFINENLNQHVTDIFVNDFIEQISDAKKAIEDNQQILIACKTKELFNELQNQINNDLKDEYDNIRQTELKNYIPELNEEYSSQLAMMA